MLELVVDVLELVADVLELVVDVLMPTDEIAALEDAGRLRPSPLPNTPPRPPKKSSGALFFNTKDLLACEKEEDECRESTWGTTKEENAVAMRK